MTQSLLEAIKLLEIGERASVAEINRKYRTLLFTWHPDRCREEPEKCRATSPNSESWNWHQETLHLAL